MHSDELLKKFDKPKGYIELKIPAKNKLSFHNNIFFRRLFKILNIDDVIKLYTAILSEKKNILIISKCLYDVYAIGSCLISLIEPI